MPMRYGEHVMAARGGMARAAMAAAVLRFVGSRGETAWRPIPTRARSDAAKNASAMETIEVVRNVLEVERLVELRGKLVRRAHAGLNEDQGSPLPH
jgi:hypothetical protein